MQPSPCSETTEPISINDTPLDAPWSESVPFWILLKLVHIKWMMRIPSIGRFKALRFLTLYDVTGSDMELDENIDQFGALNMDQFQ